MGFIYNKQLEEENFKVSLEVSIQNSNNLGKFI